MSFRSETFLWMLQRASAVVLALCVFVHLATIIYAVQGGLSAAEILGRVGVGPVDLAKLKSQGIV